MKKGIAGRVPALLLLTGCGGAAREGAAVPPQDTPAPPPASGPMEVARPLLALEEGDTVLAWAAVAALYQTGLEHTAPLSLDSLTDELGHRNAVSLPPLPTLVTPWYGNDYSERLQHTPEEMLNKIRAEYYPYMERVDKRRRPDLLHPHHPVRLAGGRGFLLALG